MRWPYATSSPSSRPRRTRTKEISGTQFPAARLGAITVLALAAAILVRPDGLGVMFGLAVGQVILVLNTVIPVMVRLRSSYERNSTLAASIEWVTTKRPSSSG